MIARRLSVAAGLTLAGGAILFGVAAPPENCPPITAEQTHAAAMLATDWIVDNQTDDGRWLYEYDRVREHVSPDYNEVRHAGVMSSLYQAAAGGHDGALDSRGPRARVGARQRRRARQLDRGHRLASGVGRHQTPCCSAGLAERRIDTGDPIHDDLMRRLGRFLTEQTEPSGALLAYWDLGPERARPDVYSIYYTGEAYWALGRMHRLFPDEGWGEVADRMGNYMATVRDDVEDVGGRHSPTTGRATASPRRPPIPIGLPANRSPRPNSSSSQRQGGLIGQRVRSISQRFGPWGVAVRGTFTPRGGGYGVFGEGLTGLWRAAVLDERLAAERNDLAERATCISGLALDVQVTAAEAESHPRPREGSRRLVHRRHHPNGRPTTRTERPSHDDPDPRIRSRAGEFRPLRTDVAALVRRHPRHRQPTALRPGSRRRLDPRTPRRAAIGIAAAVPCWSSSAR